MTWRKDGRDLTLTWPKPLPVPTLDGNSATYPEVLRGVDLRVAADATGFSHQLVVKTREAASDPALASIDFGLKGNGVTLRKEQNGELKAFDPAGQPLFSSAKPQMWDSGADQPLPTAPAKSFAESALKQSAPAQAPSTAAATPTAPSVDRVPAVDGISLRTKEADLGVELKGDRLTLTTDRKLLTAPDTKFPVVIDPIWRDDWKSAWALAYKHNGIAGSAGKSYWNGGNLSRDARVGCSKDPDYSYALVCAKTFFQIGMGHLARKQILDSTFRIQQKHSGSWNCQSGEIQIWDTDTITGSTSWNNQPAWKRMVDSSSQSYGGRNCTSDGSFLELDVTSAVSDANGDGRSDMATVYDFGNHTTALYTLRANEGGGFMEPVLAFNSGLRNFNAASAQWVAGDFNTDGRDDLVALYGYDDGANALFTFLGQADGTFKSLPRSAYVAPGNWDAFKAKLVAGDFNGDGRDDILALYGSGDGTVAAYTLLARPDGGFADPVKSWTRKPGDWNYNASRLTSGDYNGDGRADAAIMFDYGNGRSALFTLTGRPDGGLNDDFVSWTRESGWWGSSLGNLVSGDTDKDGRADVSVMYNTAKGATSAYTFKARPDGGFNEHLRSWEAAAGTW
ncbi:hypothetical protein AVW11_10490 [Streptomyces amritsarensis]|uniref:VCBS repeat-containing protein n=1 Tax=Streptomyces amritsarensis TaxID=681158 RepID=A0ABX3G8Y1_9ACTN|nr:VCBS repeat-containing protein [Streptomyces amritsarensis]OLZ69205.1 hypothetical protein AVW11_10490 [Streptomyces amritsarensis]